MSSSAIPLMMAFANGLNAVRHSQLVGYQPVSSIALVPSTKPSLADKFPKYYSREGGADSNAVLSCAHYRGLSRRPPH
eukprot:scaffold167293_cov35-Tisochrysis_lutea.AAC.5